jgi:hypothetical protein
MGRTSKRTRCFAGRILMLVLALTVPLFAQQQSTSALWRGLVKTAPELRSTEPFVVLANGGTEDVARRCGVRGDTKH